MLHSMKLSRITIMVARLRAVTRSNFKCASIVSRRAATLLEREAALALAIGKLKPLLNEFDQIGDLAFLGDRRIFDPVVAIMRIEHPDARAVRRAIQEHMDAALELCGGLKRPLLASSQKI